MHKYGFLILVFALLSFNSLAQVIDTSAAINSWKLMHNYTRFEDTDLDTVLFRFHTEFNPILDHGFSYEYLGIVGHAANHIDYFKRPGNDAFFFGNGCIA